MTDTTAPKRAPAQAENYSRGTNQGGMREGNERVVLTVLRRRPGITKAEISRTTGLSAQTVARLIAALEEDGLILRGTPQRGRIGQPAIPLTLNPEGAIFLGMKVGRRSVEMIAIDFLGAVLDREQVLHSYPDFDDVLAFTVAAAERIRERLPENLKSRVAGLGVAMPFHLWNWATRIGVDSAAMANWQHRDLRAEIAEALDVPVFLQNDATAAASAEMVFGKESYGASALSFYIAFFVGGGLVLNHSLYAGTTGNAAGLGPLTIKDRDGQARTLIEVASLSVLEQKLAGAGVDTQRLWTAPDAWDFPADIVDAWCRDCAHALASASLNVQTLLDLETILIDGWLPRDILGRLVSATRDAFAELELAGIEVPQFVQGTVGKDARPIGAASLPLGHRYLQI
ncbi:MAG: ROK family transcriptional regulator [Pseudomonadota bacterium]